MSRSLLSCIRPFLIFFLFAGCDRSVAPGDAPRARERLQEGWTFMRYESGAEADGLIYDVRPEVTDRNDSKDADTEPTAAMGVNSSAEVLKPWILPTGNAFIKDSSRHYARPEGNPGSDFPFTRFDFDDSDWKQVRLPHDWAIQGPFMTGRDAEVSGGMGRLPSNGVAWYRKQLDIPASDAGRSIFLEVEGAMSYAMVWLNGQLVGGWPYGYNSWQVDLTPYIRPGDYNQLAIRVDNPNHSARWYPGGGLYRNVWLIKTSPVHISQWGTYITSRDISESSATMDMRIQVDNDSDRDQSVEVRTDIFALDDNQEAEENPVATSEGSVAVIPSGKSILIQQAVQVPTPRRWGPPPTQQPNLYLAVHQVLVDGQLVDEYETRFGIRDLVFDPEQGLLVNGEAIRIQGANQHHDLGALGAAFNRRAAERQLEILREAGVNAIRMAHNPPAPELLDLTDEMGFLVVDEVFDSWERKKTPHDFHLIFPDWYEQDLRSFIRRDRNHPSIIMWSYGNEVGEQYTELAGAELAMKLRKIVAQEDPTRPSTASMNFAKPGMHFPESIELISLNYQGEGIRDAPAYNHLRGITTSPLYPAFHEAFPEKVIVSSETAAALSTRGTYLFPVFPGISAPVEEGSGGDPDRQYVSAYELYTAPFGSSADKVFRSQDQHSYVSGQFVWSGWDYLGEPTPYYGARSSYFGFIDLAGFPKDRFYLYQSYWRPEHPMVHILPHWNWPERVGEVTPVHVFTSGDEVELFLNGESYGRKQKGKYEYRLRWDDVVYQPGELKAIAYKNGEEWAEQIIQTTGPAAQLKLTADRSTIAADGDDLSFVTVQVLDAEGRFVPDANITIDFSLEGPGKIVATDNGDPTDMTAFSSSQRSSFNGLALAIVRPKKGATTPLTLTVRSGNLTESSVEIGIQ